MADPALVARLEALPALAAFPREELEWLVSHGELESHDVGHVVGPKGQPIEKLWIVLSGHMAVHVDRGAGPKRVVEWRAGDVTGMLPYSRMTGPPGDNRVEEPTELLTIGKEHFPEMIHRCPTFTAGTVHSMLDRARTFNTSDLHDEKMVSLGKLAAGLAHELNNPSSATVRSSKLLLGSLADGDEATRTLAAAGVSPALVDTLEQACSAGADDRSAPLSPMELADREDEIAAWLAQHRVDRDHAESLAATAITIQVLDDLAGQASGEALDAALRWVSARSTTRLLAAEIGEAATRIHELVSAVKKFTYMDNLAGAGSVDVVNGLRDTIGVLAARARTKAVSVSLRGEPDLPRVQGSGGELNQVWMSLLDNALDAAEENGRVEISVGRRRGRVVVRIVDDGAGIEPDVLPHIFDPFFTTKPPGHGTGLGLEMARRLVRRHLGEISVESEPGRTEFCVSLVPETAEGE